jgi:succinate dehydrogenase/fumarate reductase flavoprotein subunit
MGYEAGKEAAKFIRQNGVEKRVEDQEIAAEKERLFYPCHNSGGISPREYEDEIRRVVTNDIGYQRSEERLRAALEKLKKLAAKEPTLQAQDYHQLMRVHEARNIREVAEMVATAALERRESRGSFSHFRADFPNRDDANWRKMIVLKKRNAGYEVDYRPIGLQGSPGDKNNAHTH